MASGGGRLRDLVSAILDVLDIAVRNSRRTRGIIIMTVNFKMFLNLLLLGVTLGFAPDAQAEEQRCKDLGANCVCSEPLNTLSYAVQIPYFNASDSSVKECNIEGVAGAVFARNGNGDDIFGTDLASIMNALPSGHTNSYVARGADGHTGIFWVGGRLGSSFVKRAAIRLYVYYSPDFEFANENACESHKHIETDHMITTIQTAGFSAYGWLQGWSTSLDCCFSGPNTSSDIGPPYGPIYKGKWWRFEGIVVNRAGGPSPNGFQYEAYIKNVTDNTPETKVLDTRGTYQGWPAPTNNTPPSRQDALAFAAYRQGTCKGHYAFSHLMLAGWDTDQEQRIGVAKEIEEGGNTAPSAPANLQIR